MKGPYSKIVRGYVSRPNGNRVAMYESNYWYRTDNKTQTRLPLPWEREKSYVRSWPYGDDSAVQADNAPAYYYANGYWGRDTSIKSDLFRITQNKAYARLMDKIRETAGVGQNLAEYKQTLGLLRGTIDALKSPIKAFAKAAHRVFRKRESGYWRTPLEELGQAWLIFHFGVEPLIKDLHSIMERLESDSNFTWERHTASAKGRWGVRINEALNKDAWYSVENYVGTVRYSMDVRLKDPQLALLNDFGLINPASIAWELVPFSFVVDWFYPVGSYLNSFTDLLGYETRNPSTTYMLSWKAKSGYIYTQGKMNAGSYDGVKISRRLTGPTFKLPPVQIPDRLSPVRGATSIALIVQVLKNR